MGNNLNEKTPAKNLEMVKVVNYLETRQGNVNEAFKRVPVEIWKKIFDDFQNLHKNPDDKNKGVSSLRGVSDYWRSIVDNHFDFEITLSNGLLSRPLETLSHVRLKSLEVSTWTTIIHPRKLLFFLYPQLLSKRTSKSQKFLKLLDTVPNLLENLQLNIKQKDLNSWDNLHVNIIPQQPSALINFWEKFTKLDLNIPYIDIKYSGASWDVLNLKLIFALVHLPNLKEFKMRTTWRTMMDNLPLSFLLRHHPSVKNVHLELDFHKEEMRKLRHQQHQPYNYMDSVQDLENIQLESLTFEGGAICQVGRDTWIPLLKSQRNLNNLKILDCNRANPLSFNELGILVKQNYSTLTSLHLMVHFVGEIDLKVFQNMTCLQTLILHKNISIDTKPTKCFAKIVNAASLPVSLEKLVIKSLAMDCQTVHKFARAPQFINLKYLELSEIGVCNPSHSQCISDEVIYAFLEKEKLEVLEMNPVLCRVKPSKEGGDQQISCGRLQLRLLPKMK